MLLVFGYFSNRNFTTIFIFYNRQLGIFLFSFHERSFMAIKIFSVVRLRGVSSKVKLSIQAVGKPY